MIFEVIQDERQVFARIRYTTECESKDCVGLWIVTAKWIPLPLRGIGISEKADCYRNHNDHTVSTLVCVMDEANRRRFSIQARP